MRDLALGWARAVLLFALAYGVVATLLQSE